MFEIVLFVLIVLSGVVILTCKYTLGDFDDRDLEPWYLDYAKSFFPILLIVFLLRGFVAEPFRIPSGSMLPTLEVGDFLLVNKHTYGLRLPILHKKIVAINEPRRGDVMVFRYPKDDKTNYIKRVIGVPGDTIEYRHKRLYVNGDLVSNLAAGDYQPFSINGQQNYLNRYVEQLPELSHDILIDPHRQSQIVRETVPEGHYFVLGDNRDHSADSRYWGFVPDANIVGRAFLIWFHWNSHPGGGFKFSRVGTDI